MYYVELTDPNVQNASHKSFIYSFQVINVFALNFEEVINHIASKHRLYQDSKLEWCKSLNLFIRSWMNGGLHLAWQCWMVVPSFPHFNLEGSLGDGKSVKQLVCLMILYLQLLKQSCKKVMLSEL